MDKIPNYDQEIERRAHPENFQRVQEMDEGGEDDE